MITNFKIEGGAELAKVLEKLPQAVKRDTLLAMLKRAAEPMRQRMSENAPRGGDRVHREGEPTGHLADNIRVSVATRLGSVEGGRWAKADEFQAAVAVGPAKEYFYGLFWEYGTVKLSARSFARPAFDNVAPTSLDLIQQDIWDALNEVVTRYAPTAVTNIGGGGGHL